MYFKGFLSLNNINDRVTLDADGGDSWRNLGSSQEQVSHEVQQLFSTETAEWAGWVG